MKIVLDIPEDAMKILLNQIETEREKAYADAGGKEQYLMLWRYTPTFEGWVLTRLLEKCDEGTTL